MPCPRLSSSTMPTSVTWSSTASPFPAPHSQSINSLPRLKKEDKKISNIDCLVYVEEQLSSREFGRTRKVTKGIVMATRFSILLLLLCVAVAMAVTIPVATANIVEEATEKIKNPGETKEEANDVASSWADWARNKLSSGFNIKQEDAKEKAEEMMNKAGNVAVKTKDAVTNAASGAANMASEKASDASNTVARRKDQAVEAGEKAYNDAKRKLGDAYSSAKDTAADAASAMKDKKDDAAPAAENALEGAKEKLGEAYTNAEYPASEASGTMKNRAAQPGEGMGEAFNSAKEKLKETYSKAKDTMTESAKANYEAAKEKASQATDELGSKMKNKDEL